MSHSNDDFECPHCGIGMEGVHHFDDSPRDRIEAECQNVDCQKKFILERDFDVTYTAWAKEADPDRGGTDK